MKPILLAVFLLGFAATATTTGRAQAEEMRRVGAFEIDVTEVSIGAFRAFVEATGTVTAAERAGGGEVYEAGWVQKPGWTWQTPFGQPARDDEPAVHVTHAEAAAYCAWRGKRLPLDREWMEAAYTERRASPTAPFQTGETYPYPTGAAPEGANCLTDCGPTPALDRSSVLTRGIGHAPVGTTKPGVNGLFDMGANAWEWTEGGAQNGANGGGANGGGANGGQKLTRGGSWWYGARQMHRDHVATKPAQTAVVYIGFRCAR